MKKTSGLYEYLEQRGVLENGTGDAIEHAKKEYWAQVRKEWRANQRKECKSYTIFYTEEEYRDITKAVKEKHMSITRFIKTAALNRARESAGIDKRILGQVRALFFETYNIFDTDGEISPEVLKQFELLERDVLTILKQ